MSVLPYELAKELKEWGWPQPEFVSALSDRWVWPPNKGSAPFSTWAEIRVYSPSLSELIKGIEEEAETKGASEFALIRRDDFFFDERGNAYRPYVARIKLKDLSALTRRSMDVTDAAPEGACAWLWLGLKREAK